MNETRSLRIGTAREFYAIPSTSTGGVLGLLEIFEGSTLRNLTENPFASVLWTGNSPVFASFQVDCVVEIMTPEDPALPVRLGHAPAFRVRAVSRGSDHVSVRRTVSGSSTQEQDARSGRYPGRRSDNTVNEGHGKIDTAESKPQ